MNCRFRSVIIDGSLTLPYPYHPSRMLSSPMPMRKVLLISNTAWNIYNFRSGLIRSLIREGYQVIAVAPPTHMPVDCHRSDVPMSRYTWTTREPIPSETSHYSSHSFVY